MNLRVAVGACLLAVSISTLALAQRGSASSSLVGVWKVVEVTRTGPNAHTNTSPQPGLYTFTAGYFYKTEVTAEAPRPELPPNPTDKQLVDAWTPYFSVAGSYETKGDELIMHRFLSKGPNGMRPGTTVSDTFRLEGKDTLWLTDRVDQNGPVQNPTTRRLTRLE
jgi:hypothetical protein